MQHGIFSFLKTTLGAALLTAGLTVAQAADLRVLTHSSFTVPKPLLAQFEKDNGVKLRITKAGDAGEMLNKLILTKANPIADVVYGIDNALAPKALAADVLDSYAGAAVGRKPAAELPAPLVPVDYDTPASPGGLRISSGTFNSNLYRWGFQVFPLQQIAEIGRAHV